jgi:hypothetical protein
MANKRRHRTSKFQQEALHPPDQVIVHWTGLAGGVSKGNFSSTSKERGARDVTSNSTTLTFSVMF